jgi:hypothetical protein
MINFAHGYVWGRFRAAGWTWVNGLDTAKWSAREVGEVALALQPFGRPTWDFVAGKGQGAEEHYWRNTSRVPLSAPPSIDSGEVEHAVSKLLKYQRPFRACYVLDMALFKKCSLDPNLIMDVLESGLMDQVADSERAVIKHEPYHLLKLLQWLQEGVKRKEPGFDPNRVAQLEDGYLGLLDGHPASPVTRLGMLKSNPAFFVKLLLDMKYPSGNGPEGARTEPSKDEEARAQNAFRLLMLWQTVPGSREDKTVDEDVLFEWIQKARSMAEQQDCLQECEYRIGQVFAHSPYDKDGSWPCTPVRDAIEAIASDDVAEGFEVGIYNKRGAYNKSPDEGGDQERDKARDFQDWAEACKIEWPRTAASLQRVADEYAIEARREDATRELRWRG